MSVHEQILQHPDCMGLETFFDPDAEFKREQYSATVYIEHQGAEHVHAGSLRGALSAALRVLKEATNPGNWEGGE